MGGGRTALCWSHIYSDILQNAPFRSQIFTIFFASGARGIYPPNQNPADALGRRSALVKHFTGYSATDHRLRAMAATSPDAFI